jgi:hypothetical protein
VKELSDSIKRPNLRLTGIEEGEEMQAKRVSKIFNKLIAGNSQILRKFCPFKYKMPPGHQIDLTKIEPSNCILSLKQ